jgi:HD-GYP domain-containing protein (c-di-GMP phosphodiesterase class II)
LEHHERWDGQGYPKGIRGKDISMQGRIIAIADSFDAMTSDRIYCKALSLPEATDEIKKCAGTQFDPNIAKIFVEEVLLEKW